MSDHIERMETEHRELQERLTKLNAFIYGSDDFNDLDKVDQALLIQQAGFMTSYSSTLASRIWRNK